MSDPIFTPFMFNPIVVESSSLARLDYDDRQRVLQAEFRDGSIYQYPGVPLETYQELLQAESKGAYFNRRVRRLFPYVKLRAALSPSTP
jgi:hypothetical protein